MTVFWVTTIPSEKSAAAEALDLNSEEIRAAVEKGADMGGSIPKIVFKEGVTQFGKFGVLATKYFLMLCQIFSTWLQSTWRGTLRCCGRTRGFFSMSW